MCGRPDDIPMQFSCHGCDVLCPYRSLVNRSRGSTHIAAIPATASFSADSLSPRLSVKRTLAGQSGQCPVTCLSNGLSDIKISGRDDGQEAGNGSSVLSPSEDGIQQPVTDCVVDLSDKSTRWRELQLCAYYPIQDD